MSDTPRKLTGSQTTDWPGDRVDVWIVPLVESANQQDLTHWLSPDERARAERFVFQRDRQRFARGRGALRSILARYLHCDPAEVEFAYGESGKPRLAGGNTDGLHFNASGSVDLAVCAVTCGRNLGVDIEQLRNGCDPDVVRYALCDLERAQFEQVPIERQTAVFYRTWTRKEAYLKAMGCGLSRPLASFAVSVSPEEPPRLIRDDLAPSAIGSWWFADFDPAPGWVGTVVCSGQSLPVRRLDWTI